MFGAALVRFFRWQFCLLELHELPPKKLKEKKNMTVKINELYAPNDKRQTHRMSVICIRSHLYLLITGWEPSLLKDHDMVADPLEQNSYELIVLPPAQLQILKPTQQNGEQQQFSSTTADNNRGPFLLMIHHFRSLPRHTKFN